MTAYEVIQELKGGPPEKWIATYKALRNGRFVLEELDNQVIECTEKYMLLEYIEKYAMDKPELKEIIKYKIKKDIEYELFVNERLLKNAHNYIRNKKPGFFEKIKMFFRAKIK